MTCAIKIDYTQVNFWERVETKRLKKGLNYYLCQLLYSKLDFWSKAKNRKNNIQVGSYFTSQRNWPYFYVLFKFAQFVHEIQPWLFGW